MWYFHITGWSETIASLYGGDRCIPHGSEISCKYCTSSAKETAAHSEINYRWFTTQSVAKSFRFNYNKNLAKTQTKKKNKINSSTSNRLRLLWMFQSDILPNMVRTKASYLVTEHNDKQCLFFWSSSRQLWISLLPIIHQIWCLCCKNVTKFITAWGYENDKYYCSFYNGIFIITEGGSNHIQCQGFQTLSQMN